MYIHNNVIVLHFNIYYLTRVIKHSLVLLAVTLIYKESVGERMIQLSNVISYTAAYYVHNSRYILHSIKNSIDSRSHVSHK
jgi:hypothetical protein